MVYAGETNARGERHGNGSCTFDGACFHYQGEWVRGLMHGSGTFRVEGACFEHSVIQGKVFKAGEISGYGSRTWFVDDRAVKRYDGEFRRGEAKGRGSLYSSSECYEGEFAANTYDGQGVKRLSSVGDDFVTKWQAKGDDCHRFEGAWRRGRLDGQGREVKPDGHTFSGSFVAGRRQHGEATWPDGSSYVGEWNGEQRHGQGEYFEARSGVRYVGLWQDDVPEKRGATLVANLDRPVVVEATKGKSKKAASEDDSVTLRPGDQLPRLAVEVHTDDSEVASCERGRQLRLTLHYFDEDASEHRIVSFFVLKDHDTSPQAAEEDHEQPSRDPQPLTDGDLPVDDTLEGAMRAWEHVFAVDAGLATVDGRVVLSSQSIPGSYVLRICDVSRWSGNTEAAAMQQDTPLFFAELPRAEIPFLVVAAG